MKINIFLFAFIFCSAAIAHAQEAYDVANIPAELLNKSTVDISNEEQNLVIKSQSSAYMTYKTAVTILSKNGEDML